MLKSQMTGVLECAKVSNVYLYKLTGVDFYHMYSKHFQSKQFFVSEKYTSG